MDTPTKEMWRAVVALLVTDPGALLNFQALQATARLSRLHPVALTGELAPLNHLIALETNDPAGHAGMMALIARKRAALGLPALEVPKVEKFDKAEYMRHFMAQKRVRTTRAAEIENLIRGDRAALRGVARLEFMRVQGAKWNEELERRISAAREAAGGRVPRETLDALRAQFWAWVDSQLDELEAEARRPR